jgi:hypothetical protein
VCGLAPWKSENICVETTACGLASTAVAGVSSGGLYVELGGCNEIIPMHSHNCFKYKEWGGADCLVFRSAETEPWVDTYNVESDAWGPWACTRPSSDGEDGRDGEGGVDGNDHDQDAVDNDNFDGIQPLIPEVFDGDGDSRGNDDAIVDDRPSSPPVSDGGDDIVSDHGLGNYDDDNARNPSPSPSDHAGNDNKGSAAGAGGSSDGGEHDNSDGGGATVVGFLTSVVAGAAAFVLGLAGAALRRSSSPHLVNRLCFWVVLTY